MSYNKNHKTDHLEQALLMRRQGFSYRQLGEVFGVSKFTIFEKIRKFEDTQSQRAMKKDAKARTGANKIAPQRIKRGAEPTNLDKRISILEQKLKEAELRADFYNEMINVAESKFNIQIRKKAGNKQ